MSTGSEVEIFSVETSSFEILETREHNARGHLLTYLRQNYLKVFSALIFIITVLLFCLIFIIVRSSYPVDEPSSVRADNSTRQLWTSTQNEDFISVNSSEVPPTTTSLQDLEDKLRCRTYTCIQNFSDCCNDIQSCCITNFTNYSIKGLFCCRCFKLQQDYVLQRFETSYFPKQFSFVIKVDADLHTWSQYDIASLPTPKGLYGSWSLLREGENTMYLKYSVIDIVCVD